MLWNVNALFAAAEELSVIPPWGHLLIFIAVVLVSFVVGGYLGKKLRMPDHGWKIGLCLVTLLLSVDILVMGPPLKLGIDLSGGALLVYEVDQSKKTNPSETLSGQQMDNLITAVSRRVNPGGQKEVTVRKYGNEQIEIIVPEKDAAQVERIENTISRAGSLEFRILADRRKNPDLITQAERDTSKMTIVDSAGNLRAWWVPLKKGESFGANIGQRQRKGPDGKEITEVLVLNDIYNVTGAYLTNATSEWDQKGQPAVGFYFNSTGGQLFGKLTTAYRPDEQQDFYYLLGIILDGELCSAPRIMTVITDRGQITGNFTPADVQDLVNVLNAGSLPAALMKEPISKLFTGPTLGTDTIQASTRAMIIACVLVPLFMLFYYHFSGLVANIALALNMLILFAVMRACNAAFTLTAFAGLALTVGMAVDNNILVFERLREELDRGATLRMAIRNAFHRAGTTIVDCNVTHLIVAIVLWYLGSDQLKGFAITLGVGVVTSMFTSVFVARVIYDVAEKRQWLTKAKMLRLIGHTNFDFMGWFPYCLTASILITVLAVFLSFARGKGLFDIDFTGGVSVQVKFDNKQKVDKVRSALEGKLPDVAINNVWSKPEEEGLAFVIDTSETKMDVVKQSLADAFPGQLAHNTVTFTEPTVIPAAKKEAPPAEKTPPSKTEPSKYEKVKPAEAQKTPALGDPYAGGSQSKLKFKDEVSNSTAKQAVSAALDRLGVSAPSANFFQLSREGYMEGSPTPHQDWTLKIFLPPEKTKSLLANMQQQLAATPDFPASSTIGGAVAENTQYLAAYALVASWLGIIVFLWVRFQGVAFGFAAVVGLVHDVFVMLGAVAASYYLAKVPGMNWLMIEPVKVNLPIVAAFLTIIGYSVNDTIVVFDRIREVRGKDPALTRKMVNDSTNQTLSRTLLTSLTVFMVVIVLYLFGGEALHGFAFALIVGVVTGTYSSIYISAPILLWLVGKHKEHGA
jgi:SecD/SecF fusion protein